MTRMRWILAAALAPVACGPGVTDLPTDASGGLGALTVTVATTGTNPDPDGYHVWIDEANSAMVAPQDVVTFTDLAPKTYILQIAGVAPNCTPRGGPSQPVKVEPEQTVYAALTVECV
jgi:hypothetical protein